MGGTTYAYRDQGDGGDVPVLLFQHFRGTLDNWDPILIDAVAFLEAVDVDRFLLVSTDP